jgi:hypothetical protein
MLYDNLTVRLIGLLFIHSAVFYSVYETISKASSINGPKTSGKSRGNAVELLHSAYRPSAESLLSRVLC